MEKLLLMLAAVIMYTLGENKKQIFKQLMGIPLALIAFLFTHNLWALLAIPSYYIASIAFGYGDKNIWTKWIGKEWAVILTGFMLGLASFPIVGIWAILQATISSWAWYGVYVFDEAGKIKEPWVAILRSLGASVCL